MNMERNTGTIYDPAVFLPAIIISGSFQCVLRPPQPSNHSPKVSGTKHGGTEPYFWLYIGEDTSILGTGNVWRTIIQTVIETGKRDPPPTVRSILGASVSLEDGPPLRIGG